MVVARDQSDRVSLQSLRILFPKVLFFIMNINILAFVRSLCAME
jgi:hypothetical protein